MKADYKIVMMASLLGVSRSGFYAWETAQKITSSRQKRYQDLTKLVKEIHADSDGVYGAPRIHTTLKKIGYHVSRKTIAKIMQEQNIQGISPRRFKVSTIRDKTIRSFPNDLVQRNWDAGKLNQIWVSDITYLNTWQGWVYLAIIMDTHSRKIIGWAIAEHMKTSLVLDALKRGCHTKRYHQK